MALLRSVATLVLAGLLSAALIAQAGARADADTMTKKLAMVMARGSTPRRAEGPVRTSFTDGEINAYFKIDGPDFLPKGVVNPEIATADGGRVHAHAIVDVDAVKNSQPRSFFSPWSLVSGMMPVDLVGVVRGANGMGTLTLESATLNSIPLPTAMLQEIVKSYSRSADLPDGFDMSRPFPLPENIVGIDIRHGVSTVEQ